MQIKRMIALCASLTLTISVAGCGSADTKDNTSSQTEQVQLDEQTDRTESDEEQNESASEGLHKKCGFREIGYREKIAKDRFGEWQNTTLMEYRAS